MGQSILSMESLDGSVVIAHVLVSAMQLQLSESISTISMEYQSECEKVNLWLKIKNMIGHYGF